MESLVMYSYRIHMCCIYIGICIVPINFVLIDRCVEKRHFCSKLINRVFKDNDIVMMFFKNGKDCSNCREMDFKR